MISYNYLLTAFFLDPTFDSFSHTASCHSLLEVLRFASVLEPLEPFKEPMEPMEPLIDSISAPHRLHTGSRLHWLH